MEKSSVRHASSRMVREKDSMRHARGKVVREKGSHLSEWRKGSNGDQGMEQWILCGSGPSFSPGCGLDTSHCNIIMRVISAGTDQPALIKSDKLQSFRVRLPLFQLLFHVN